MSEHYEVVVVGSGAGGGVVAGELAERGRRVLLLEAGPHKTAADYMRWEARASHELWWPPAFAEPQAAPGPPLILFRGRCVGGTTVINTKVALRPDDQDYSKWQEAGAPFRDVGDLRPYLERVEKRLGVRERSDWQRCVHTVVPGSNALGAELEPVASYTDENCMRCGSCLQGCPTNAGKSTLNTYIHRPWVQGALGLHADCDVRRVVIEDSEARGIEYVGPDGAAHVATGDVVVVACGALATPGLLIRSGLRGSEIGRHLGFHPARLVKGLFDEPQDAHMVYPISAHCMKFRHDADGGYVVEASTIQDPIGFATALCDEQGLPMWGHELVDTVARYRYFTGLLTMVNDENHRDGLGEQGRE